MQNDRIIFVVTQAFAGYCVHDFEIHSAVNVTGHAIRWEKSPRQRD
jgi:hypothetical protein